MLCRNVAIIWPGLETRSKIVQPMNREVSRWAFLRLVSKCFASFLKPWPNWLASSRKLKTWVYSRLYLARPCVHLRWRLTMTCAQFGRDQICTQVFKASFSPFGHPTQVNASWVPPISLLLGNEIEDSLLQNVFLCDLRVLARKLTSPFGHPTRLLASSTCVHLRLLDGPFD